MKNLKITLLLAIFVLTASFTYAQGVRITPIQSDSTVSSTKPIPEPTIYIGTNILGGEQTKDALLKNPCITAKGGDLEWSIISYRVTFVRQINGNGVEESPITITGACFTKEIISKIKSYSSGTVIEFSNIKIQSSAGIRTIPTTLAVRVR
jgi:hypothetical protein